MTQSPHLLAAVSSHSLGFLAQVGPVINALRHQLPDLALTLRGGYSRELSAKNLYRPDGCGLR